MTTEIEKAFQAPAESIKEALTELTEHIAIEDDAISKLDAELKERRQKLNEAKEKLAEELMQAGLDTIKLESGLSPKLKITRKYFKQAGIPDEVLFAWLNKNDLGSIIKPTVHYGTLQSTLKEYEEQGNILPDEIFNATSYKSVTMYGKSKFIEQKEKQKCQSTN